MIINFKTALPDIAYCKIDQIIRLIVYIVLELVVHTQEWLLLFHSNQHCRAEGNGVVVDRVGAVSNFYSLKRFLLLKKEVSFVRFTFSLPMPNCKTWQIIIQ